MALKRDFDSAFPSTESHFVRERLDPSENYQSTPARSVSPGWDAVVLRPFENTRLDTLPAEILIQIFWYSNEPSLIHTCSRLWKILPSHRWYSKSLAVLAFCGQDEKDNIVPFAQQYSLPFLEPPLSSDCRTSLQKNILSSNWFGTRQFTFLHLEIFCGLVRETGKHPSFALSKSQWRRVNRLLKDVRKNPTWATTLRGFVLRIKNPHRRTLEIKIGPHRIDILNMNMGLGRQSHRLNVFDFLYISDGLLQRPFTREKTRFLVMIMNSKTVSEIKNQVKWDRSLLFQGIQDAIMEDNRNVLRVLLDLDRIDMGPGEHRAVDPAHFRHAILLGKAEPINDLVDADRWLSGNPDLATWIQEAFEKNSPNHQAVRQNVVRALSLARMMGTSEGQALGRLTSILGSGSQDNGNKSTQ